MSLAPTSRSSLPRLGLLACGSPGAWRYPLDACVQLGPEVFVALHLDPPLFAEDQEFLLAQGCRPTVYTTATALLEAGGLGAIELHAAPEQLADLALRAALSTQALLLAPPFASKAADARALAETLKRMAMPVLALDGLRHHSMIERAQRLINKDEQIGDVHSMRVKTLIGRYEDEAPLNAEQIARRLAAYGAAPLALIERLFGPVAEVFAYGSEKSRMLSFSLVKPACYGVHEVSYSPYVVFPDDGPNWQFSLEMTGTDGVLWLNNLAGRLYEEPTLLIKRKDLLTAYDDQVADDWGQLSKRLRLDFLARPQLSPTLVSELFREASFLEAVQCSLDTARPVRIGSGSESSAVARAKR